jgi:hypothetical protein
MKNIFLILILFTMSVVFGTFIFGLRILEEKELAQNCNEAGGIPIKETCFHPSAIIRVK